MDFSVFCLDLDFLSPHEGEETLAKVDTSYKIKK